MTERVVLGTALLGRAIGAGGALLDDGPPLHGLRRCAAADVPAPRERVAVTEPFWTGIRALDGPLAFGRGARIGIFGAPGAGKSTLLEQLVAGSRADATVVALIGERGREAERWLRAIGTRTSIVCATSDRSAAERLAAAGLAFAQAAALRSRGLHVLLVLDSLARVAAAARDVAIALGEPVGRAGFPPSVVARQARLLECAGAAASPSSRPYSPRARSSTTRWPRPPAPPLTATSSWVPAWPPRAGFRPSICPRAPAGRYPR